VVGGDGATHNGSYDLSFLRCVPNMTVMAPSDEDECRQMLYTATTLAGPSAVRYPRGQGPGVPIQKTMTALPVGRGELRRTGRSGLLLLSFGTMLQAALAAGELLDATVVNMRFVKPLDAALLRTLVPQHVALVTLEENAVSGGAGSGVGEFLDAEGLSQPRLQIGIADVYIGHGSREECLQDAGLDSPSVVRRIDQWWQALPAQLKTARPAPKMASVGRTPG
jgi:1-deoxy-D-xylulose-5-phosphate synthase